MKQITVTYWLEDDDMAAVQELVNIYANKGIPKPFEEAFRMAMLYNYGTKIKEAVAEHKYIAGFINRDEAINEIRRIRGF